MKLSPTVKGVSSFKVHEGSSVLFWKDAWQSEILSEAFPRAFSYTNNEDMFVRDFLTVVANPHETFQLPLSSQAYDEFMQMSQLISDTHLEENGKDIWTYIWVAIAFKAKNYYDCCFRNIEVHAAYKWLWRSKSIPKHKVFGWFLLTVRLNTRNMLKRRHYNIGSNLNCLLCGFHVEETVKHLFFHCTFSVECWDIVGIHWSTQQHMLKLLEEAKQAWDRPMFMDVFLVAAWSLWKERNNHYFQHIMPSISSWKQRFKSDFANLKYKGYEDIKEYIAAYLTALV